MTTTITAATLAVIFNARLDVIRGRSLLPTCSLTVSAVACSGWLHRLAAGWARGTITAPRPRFHCRWPRGQSGCTKMSEGYRDISEQVMAARGGKRNLGWGSSD